MQKASDPSQPVAQSVKQPLKIPEVPKTQNEVITKPNFATPVQSIGNSSTKVIDQRMMQNLSKDILFYPDPFYRPPPKPVKIPVPEIPGNMDINLELNMDCEEKYPFQVGVISET